MNERDSEIIAQSLMEQGNIETYDVESADVIIINTCSIRAKAEQKVMSMLGVLRQKKKLRPDLKICVAGCVAQQEGSQLLERMPHIDLVVGTQNIYNIPELLDKCNKEGRQIVTSMSDSYQIPKFIPEISSLPSSLTIAPFKKFVTIMQGCNNFCTYCVVPYTRGREISRKKDDIIDEVKVLVDAGVKEITLLGQNVNSYGKANKVTQNDSPYSFPALLEDIAQISGIKRIRFTTSHPKDLSHDLMRCFRDVEVLCRQIHLPVQSGSDNILLKMNRKYCISKYMEKVDALRSYCPEIAITTDMIIGFPGETDRDFEKTMDLLEHVRYDGSFSFKYSDRPGTKSSGLPDKIPEKIKSERLSRFQKRQNQISLEKNKGYVGKILPVMVESIDKSGFQGRSEFNHVVHVLSNISFTNGDMIDVFIYHAGQHSLKACMPEDAQKMQT